MEKTLDVKLAKILSDPSCGEFILADAKDADMAGETAQMTSLQVKQQAGVAAMSQANQLPSAVINMI